MIQIYSCNKILVCALILKKIKIILIGLTTFYKHYLGTQEVLSKIDS